MREDRGRVGKIADFIVSELCGLPAFVAPGSAVPLLSGSVGISQYIHVHPILIHTVSECTVQCSRWFWVLLALQGKGLKCVLRT